MDSIVTERLRAGITGSSEDYAAEAIAAGLVDAGVPAEQLIIQSMGASKRAARKDVSAFHTEVLEAYNAEFLFLDTNRDGIYDGLPEAVFHEPTRATASPDAVAIIEEMQVHREEEADARTFFLPFEQEYHHIKRTLYAIEAEFESVCDTSRLVALFSGKWPILARLEPRQAYLFFRMIPMLHEIRDDFPLVAHSMNMLLQVPVEVLPYIRPVLYNSTAACALGTGSLGMDTIIGGGASDGETDVLVKVGPFGRAEVMVCEDLSEGGTYNQGGTGHSLQACASRKDSTRREDVLRDLQACSDTNNTQRFNPDLIPDNTAYSTDAISTHTVCVEQFVQGGSKEGLIEDLCGYFFGAQYEIKIEFVCAETGFILEGEAMLGVNSVL